MPAGAAPLAVWPRRRSTAMERLGADRHRIRVGIGPCIGPASYEVGPEFPQPMVANDPAAERYFTIAPGRAVSCSTCAVISRIASHASAYHVSKLRRMTLSPSLIFFSAIGAPDFAVSRSFGLGLSAIVIDD